MPENDFPVTPGRNGLSRILAETEAATGEVYLQGAHVTSWQPRGQKPVLWLSGESWFEKGKPIRGGVPICFPWFGAHATDPGQPGHGTARISEWTCEHTEGLADGSARLNFQTNVAPFQCRFQVQFGRTLSMQMNVTLSAQETAPRSFELALHTYFSVSDIRSTIVHGLERTAYLDKTRGATLTPPAGMPIRFTEETDRVYLNTEDTVRLEDPGANRAITVEKSGSRSTVIWNPWIDKARRMPDFGDNEWTGMVCIESANVGDHRVTLNPGESSQLSVTVQVQPL